VGTGAAGETCVPAAATTEICDGLDNDCDGAVDDGASVGTAGTAGGVVAALCTLPAGSTVVGICRSQAKFICQSGGIICQAALPETTDLPGDGTGDAADTNCDGWEGDLIRSIFVSTLGAADGDGTMASPFDSMQLAFAAKQATPRRNQIYIGSGDFPVSNGFTLPDGDTGASIIGGYGYDSVTSRFTTPTGDTALLFGTAGATICAAGAAVCPSASTTDFESAITVRNPSSVLLKKLSIRVAKPPLNFGHVVGLACYGGATGCGGLKMVGISINLTGADGTAGVAGNPGSAGASGVTGPLTTTSWSYGRSTTGYAVPRNPGTSLCEVSGGLGGDASLQYMGFLTWNDDSFAGQSSEDLQSTGGARVVQSYGYVGSDDNTLKPALDGSPGRNASVIAGGGQFGSSAAAFVVTSGVAGSSGLAGGGGGGGGGHTRPYILTSSGYMFVAAGGAGGGGGCGGGAGGAGRAGGSVIGLYWDSATAPAAANFDVKFTLQPGNGGLGGGGGIGGEGGPQSSFEAASFFGQGGGIGGPGGHGGGGGAGGSGGNGWAVKVARRGTVSFAGLFETSFPGSVAPTMLPAGGAAPRSPRFYQYRDLAATMPNEIDPDVAAANGGDGIPGPASTRAGLSIPPSQGLQVDDCWIDILGDDTSCFASCPVGFHIDPANTNRCAPDARSCEPEISEALGVRPALGVQDWDTTSASYSYCGGTACIDPANVWVLRGSLPAVCMAPSKSCTNGAAYGTQTLRDGPIEYDFYNACTLEGCSDPLRRLVGSDCLCNEGYRDDGGLCLEGCGDPNAELLVNTCTCNAGFHSEAGRCTSDVHSCLPRDTNPVSGTFRELSVYYDTTGEQRWTGAGYSECLAQCNDITATVILGACVAPSIPCSTSAGSGLRFKFQGRSDYRPCFLTECYPGHVPQNTRDFPGECGSVTGQACTEWWECGYSHTCDLAAGTCL